MITSNKSNERFLHDKGIKDGRNTAEKNLKSTAEPLQTADKKSDGAAQAVEAIDEKQEKKPTQRAFMPEAAKRKRQGSISKEDMNRETPAEGLYGRGFLHYKKFWHRNLVDINVNGELITGIPLLIEYDILHVINEHDSYFIPVDKIDYIRTPDGLNAVNDTEI